MTVILHCTLYKYLWLLYCRIRPYIAESTGSRPISKVKLLMARLVLWWETTWESLVLYFFLFLSLYLSFLSLVMLYCCAVLDCLTAWLVVSFLFPSRLVLVSLSNPTTLSFNCIGNETLTFVRNRVVSPTYKTRFLQLCTFHTVILYKLNNCTYMNERCLERIPNYHIRFLQLYNSL